MIYVPAFGPKIITNFVTVSVCPKCGVKYSSSQHPHNCYGMVVTARGILNKAGRR